MQRRIAFALNRQHSCALILALAVLFSWSATAWGHAHPAHRSPAQNATLEQSPAQVKIRFTEDLEGAFSTLTVTSEQGKTVNSSPGQVVDAKPRVMAASLKPLTPGIYTVHWHAVSRDGHTTEGSYTFTLQ